MDATRIENATEFLRDLSGRLAFVQSPAGRARLAKLIQMISGEVLGGTKSPLGRSRFVRAQAELESTIASLDPLLSQESSRRSLMRALSDFLAEAGRLRLEAVGQEFDEGEWREWVGKGKKEEIGEELKIPRIILGPGMKERVEGLG